MNMRPKHRQDLAINLMPLIDVVFLLLIFFILTTTFVTRGELGLSLPEAGQPLAQPLTQGIDIIIDAEGKYYFNSRELVNPTSASMGSTLQELSHGDSETPLIIRADLGTDYQALVNVLDVAADLNLTHIVLQTEFKADH